MRKSARLGKRTLWAAGAAFVVLAAMLSVMLAGCGASTGQSAGGSQASATTLTPRLLHQNYVYLSDTVLLDGSANIAEAQAHGGQTLSVTWISHAYNQSADASPITLSVAFYGPFPSKSTMEHVMGLDGPPLSTPVPIAQLALQPAYSAPAIHADTWTTKPQTISFAIPSSLHAGYYDSVWQSTDGASVVERGDSPLQIG